jgi:hypothetical protein
VSQAIWGFCEPCERWRLSRGWLRSSGRARCPVCDTPAALIEKVEGGVARVRLVLELPPGAEMPLLA